MAMTISTPRMSLVLLDGIKIGDSLANENVAITHNEPISPFTAQKKPLTTTLERTAATSFMDLSAELRNIVYELALVEDGEVEIVPDCEPALLSVNRTIWDEAAAMYYSANTFKTVDLVVAFKWCDKLSRTALSSLQNVHLGHESYNFSDSLLYTRYRCHETWYQHMVKRLEVMQTFYASSGLKESAVKAPLVVHGEAQLSWFSTIDIGTLEVIQVKAAGGMEERVVRKEQDK